MADLRVKFAGMELKNPVVAASATPTKDYLRMKHCVDAGCSALVAKTPSWDRLEQVYPCPRFYVFYPEAVRSGKLFSYYTNELLCEKTPEEYAKEVCKIRPYARDHDCKIITNIMAGSAEEWSRYAELYGPIADAMELNLACPYGVELAGGKKGSAAGLSPEFLEQVVGAVRKVTDVPLIAKLPAEAGDLVQALKALDQMKVAGVHTTHRYTGLEIDIETAMPILAGGISGYGGPWQAPISRKWVLKAAQNTKLDICGGGGLDNWRDCIAHMMCGAKIVQLCTAPSVRGYKAFTATIEGINTYLDKHGYKSVNDIVGVAVPNVKVLSAIPRKDVFKPLARVDEEKCNGCGDCVDVCFYGAITMEGKQAVVDQAICDGCGLCTQMCSPGGIALYDNGKPVPTTWAGARGRIGENARR